MMKRTLFIVFVFTMIYSLQSQGLDTLFYKNYKEQSSSSEYDYYTIITRDDALTYSVKEYYKGDSLKSTYSYKTKSELNITSKNIYKLTEKKKLLKHGDYQEYLNDSIVSGESKYDMGKIIYGPVAYYEGDTLYLIVDEMPKFQGGDLNSFRDYVSAQIEYPTFAAQHGIQGRVFVQFHINKKGEVKNAKVVRGIDPSLDEEALRGIKSSPTWVPGKKDGKPVSVLLTMPVHFELTR